MTETITTPAAKGLVLGLILIVVGIGIYFSGIDMNSSIKYLSFLIFLAGIIYFINQYGKQVNFNSTFGNYFAHGFKISAIVTIIMIIYTVVFIVFFPEFKEKAMDEARKNMQVKNLPDEQIDKAIDISRKFFMTFVIGFTLLMYLFCGVIASLIGAAITKKNPNTFQHQTDQAV
ncbi:MAG: DUF4199 domain-containing protein [Ginsengibacter sp.]